jgi:peptidoglycan/xylan/chitin deacetylase (PgdA/CDA1 family)
MKGKGRLIICILLAVIFLVPCAYSVKLTVGSDKASYSATFGAGVQDAVSGFTTISQWSLTHSASAKAKGTRTLNLKESHSVGNKLGSYVEVGVDIQKAKGYDYTYSLYPGEGTSFAQTQDPVLAGEALNVNTAQSVKAYAKASNGPGYDVGVSTLVTTGSLSGYSNLAEASASGVCAFQSFGEAKTTGTGTIQLDSTARQLPAATSRTKAKLNSLELTNLPIASISTTTYKGTVTGAIEGAAMKQGTTQLQQDATIQGTYSSTSTALGVPTLKASTGSSTTSLVRKAGIVDGLGSVDLDIYIPPATTTTPASNAKKILIRADDVWWSSPGFDWMKSIATSTDYDNKKLAATFAVVPVNYNPQYLNAKDYGALADWQIYYINWLQNLDPNYVEIAQHGYEHTSFKGKTLTKQVGDMQTGMNIMKTAMGTSVKDAFTAFYPGQTAATANPAWRPYTFVAPFDEANKNTILAEKILGYHSYSGTAVKGADPAIEQFAPSLYWENWNDAGTEYTYCTIGEFQTEFDTFLASSNNYFLIETHPNTFIDDNGVWKTTADDFKNAVKYMVDTGKDKIQFMTIEQAYQADHPK